MLFYKTKHKIQLRVAAIAIICGFLLSGASSYAVTDGSSDFALAPPLATKPPCEIVRNADGSFGVVTNTDVIEFRGKETVRSVRQDETLGKSFRNRWAFVDVGYLIAQMLILTQEYKLQNPKDILIPLIKKHVRNRDGETEILLEGFNIDGIEEAREGGEITGFSLPVTRHGVPAYRLIYNLRGGDTAIQMKDGESIYVRVESVASEQDMATIAATSELLLSEPENIIIRGKIFVSQTHDKILNLLREGDKVITFDYDPDNETDPLTGLPTSPNEANWVVHAKRKSCKVWWIRPSWSRDERCGNKRDFESIVSKVDELPEISEEVVLSFCLDYFANRNMPQGEVGEWLKREKRKPFKISIRREIKHISDILQKRNIKIKQAHLAISPKYAYEEYKDIVIEALNKYLPNLQEVPSQRSTGQQREGLSNTFPSSERIHATNFQDMLTYIQAQPQSQPLIVALGTSWMESYKRSEDGRSFRHLQGKDLNELITSIRSYCESKGIPFIVDDDDKLLARINTERVKEGKTNAKVVVLAGENIVKSDEFAPLRNDEKNALVVGINNQELTTDSYIRVMEMLTLALKLSLGLEVSLDNAHITITKDNERRLYIFLPHAEPMDYEQLRQIYRVQEFA